MRSGLYTLSSPTLALIEENGHHVAQTIPQGETLAIAAEGEAFSNHLVEVVWAGRTVLMFAEDLQSRLQRVEPTTTGPTLLKFQTHKTG